MGVFMLSIADAQPAKSPHEAVPMLTMREGSFAQSRPPNRREGDLQRVPVPEAEKWNAAVTTRISSAEIARAKEWHLELIAPSPFGLSLASRLSASRFGHG